MIKKKQKPTSRPC